MYLPSPIGSVKFTLLVIASRMHKIRSPSAPDCNRANIRPIPNEKYSTAPNRSGRRNR